MYPYNVPTPGIYGQSHKGLTGDKLPLRPDKKILDMLRAAIADEIKDADYYEKLAETAADKNDKEILLGIRMDEIKHRRLFEDIYKSLAGEVPQLIPEYYQAGKVLGAEYVKSIFSELEAVEFYRKIYFYFLNVEIRDMLFEIITDEQAHAAKLNCLASMHR